MTCVDHLDDRALRIAEARIAKAAAIAVVLRSRGCTSAQAARLDARGRQAAQAIARRSGAPIGAKPASEATWGIVVAYLAAVPPAPTLPS